jgi:hypothetical protein
LIQKEKNLIDALSLRYLRAFNRPQEPSPQSSS